MTIQVKQNQTIWDIALQYAGSIEAAFDILEANGKSDTALFVGESLVVPKVVNKKVAQFFESEASIASSLEPLGVDYYIPPSSNCSPAYYQWFLNGNIIGSGMLPSGDISSVNLDAVVPPANYQITLNGWEVDQGSINAGTTTVIPIDDYANAWQRHPLWPTIPDTEDRAYIVWAVFQDEPVNGVELNFGATCSFDYGDGNINTTGTHSYDYNAITAPVLQSYDGRNYKPVLITVTLIIGNPTLFHVNNISTILPNNALDVVDRLTNTTGHKEYRLSPGVTIRTQNATYLERVKLNHRLTSSAGGFVRAIHCQVFDVPVNFVNIPNIASSQFFFNGSFKNVNFANNFFVHTSASSQPVNGLFAFTGIRSIGDMTILSNVLASLFNYSMAYIIGNINASTATNFHSGFANTINLHSLGSITVGTSLTNVQSMFQNSNVPEIVILGTMQNVTLANTNNIFNNTGNIRRCVLTGLRVGFDISGNRMQAAALNETFTSLGNANGAQTINVRNNPGAATCDTSIATSKGYTVIIL